MKYLLLLVVVLVGLAGQVHCQRYVPNPSFEDWHSVGGWYENPDFWTTNNTQLFTGVVKDSLNHHDGKYSMRVMANGVANMDTCNASGWLLYYRYAYQCIIHGNDTVVVKAVYFKNGAAYDTEMVRHTTTVTTWTYGFVHGPNVYPDSMIVQIRGGHDSATTFNIDESSLAYEGIANIASHIHAHLSPNPMHQSASLRFDNAGHAAYRWILNDAIGRVVAERRGITGEAVRIDRDGLPPGFYCWQLWDERDGGRAVGTLVME